MYHERKVVGLDTETVNGEPYCFQWYSKTDSTVDSGITYCNKSNIWNRFLSRLAIWPTNTIVYCHNLEFDLAILFFPFMKYFRDNSFELDAPGFHANILYGKVNYAEITLHDKYYEIVDSFAYFKTSLAKVAEILGIESKMKKPRKLGTVKYEGKEKAYFEKYAMHDAFISYHAGQRIQGFHRSYNVQSSISAPNLSAKILRKKFIPIGNSITSCSPEIEDAAVLSYHGGKNTLAVSPGIYKNVRMYDINSAYPYAMVSLPNFLNCDYSQTSKWTRDSKKIGIVNISGVSVANVYNPLRDHNFGVVTGPFSDIWITTYELNCLIRHKMLSEFVVNEAFYVEEKCKEPNPLRDFVVEFFGMKQTTTGVEREFYKMMLNSLYGKFIQTTGNVQEDNVLEDKQFFQAGGLWNPMIATLITGFVRSYLTELEVKYKSLHSSTDSIVTHSQIKCSKQLGALSLKSWGTIILIRPKFYLLYNAKRQIVSYATHGYHGNLKSLLSLLQSGKRTYAHQHMTKIREGYIQQKKPFVMETLFKKINIPIEGKMNIPNLTYDKPKYQI